MMGNSETLKNMIEHLKSTEFVNEKDGMIYCKKCLRRKTLLLPPLKDEPPKLVNCLCDCDKAALKAEEMKIKAMEEEKRYRDLQVASLLGERYANATFENTKLDCHETFYTAYNRCKKFCDNHIEVLKGGFGIYLVGNSGTGKTHLMACMVNDLTRKLQPCLITNFFEIAKQIKKTFGRSLYNESDFINKITEVPFLFIDDLGTEIVQKQGEDTWLQEKIYDVVNKRYNAKKPTVFSSNYNFGDLISKRGIMQKTVDRISEMSNAVLPVLGRSYRQNPNDVDLPF
jgi:DNA replication protein DnaC